MRFTYNPKISAASFITIFLFFIIFFYQIRGDMHFNVYKTESMNKTKFI